MIGHLASLSDQRLIISFAPKTLSYSILKRIGEPPGRQRAAAPTATPHRSHTRSRSAESTGCAALGNARSPRCWRRLAPRDQPACGRPSGPPATPATPRRRAVPRPLQGHPRLPARRGGRGGCAAALRLQGGQEGDDGHLVLLLQAAGGRQGLSAGADAAGCGAGEGALPLWGGCVVCASVFRVCAGWQCRRRRRRAYERSAALPWGRQCSEQVSCIVHAPGGTTAPARHGGRIQRHPLRRNGGGTVRRRGGPAGPAAAQRKRAPAPQLVTSCSSAASTARPLDQQPCLPAWLPRACPVHSGPATPQRHQVGYAHCSILAARSKTGRRTSSAGGPRAGGDADGGVAAARQAEAPARGGARQHGALDCWPSRRPPGRALACQQKMRRAGPQTERPPRADRDRGARASRSQAAADPAKPNHRARHRQRGTGIQMRSTLPCAPAP
jgi:hypothetical protein